MTPDQTAELLADTEAITHPVRNRQAINAVYRALYPDHADDAINKVAQFMEKNEIQFVGQAYSFCIAQVMDWKN